MASFVRFGRVARVCAGLGVLGLLGTGCTVPAAVGGWNNGSETDPNATSSTDGTLPAPTTTKTQDAVFKISGQVDADAMNGTSPDVSGKVTHVVAVSPSLPSVARSVVVVDSAGKFELDVGLDRLWILVFVDASHLGGSMVLATYRTNDLHTFAPQTTGRVDLGKIAFSTEYGDGVARGSVSYADWLDAMGIDVNAAAYLASVDETALRLANPDVDANGKIDALEDAKKDFRLDLQVTASIEPAHAAAIGQLLDAAPDDLTVAYGGTAIYATFPSGAFPNGWESYRSASFDNAMHYAPIGGTNVRAISAGVKVPAGDLTVAHDGDVAAFGLMALPGFDMPQGGYHFGVGTAKLTFSGVKMRSNADLTAAAKFLVPFIRPHKSIPKCVGHCGVDGIDYVWRKRVDGTWVDAKPGELALLVGGAGAEIQLDLGGDTSSAVTIAIPGTTPSGTIAWSSLDASSAATKAAALTATTSDLCHVAVAYEDKLGVHFTATIENALGVCGP